MSKTNLKAIQDLTHTLNRVEDNLTQEKEILEFIIENTTDGYWDWDMVTNYEYLSPRLKKQLGYTDKSMENSPEAWQVLCHEADLKKAIAKVQKHIASETEDFSQKLRFTHKKGHEVKVLCRGKIVDRDEDNNPLRMIGTHVIID